MISSLIIFFTLIYAISDRVGLGGRELNLNLLSENAVYYVGIYRASGRFVWPITYLLISITLLVLARLLSRKSLALIILIGVILQFVDLSFSVRQRFADINSQPLVMSLIDFYKVEPLNSTISLDIKILRLFPAGNAAQGYEAIALLAAVNGLSTDAIYTSRANPTLISHLNASSIKKFCNQVFIPNEVYFIHKNIRGEKLDCLDTNQLFFYDPYYVR